MPTEKQLLAVYHAQDVADLCNHIAWEEVLKPDLLKTREIFSKQLVSSVLGDKIQTPSGVVSSEQLAGKIFGIDFIVMKIEKILSLGDISRAKLHAEGFDLSS